MENLAEALTLANKTGVGADLLMEFVKEFLPSPSFVGCASFSFSDAKYAESPQWLIKRVLLDGTKMQTSGFEGNNGFTVEGVLPYATSLNI